MKSLIVACLFLGMTAASVLGLSSAPPISAVPVASAAPALSASPQAQTPVRTETEMTIKDGTDPGVKKIFKIQIDGIFWFEAENADGKRFVIALVTTGLYKGYTDFGDGQGGRYCKFTN